MEKQIPEGCTVKYSHLRLAVDDDGCQYWAKADGQQKLEPRGGLTTARILDAGGRVVAFGTAKCRDTDNFDRKLGCRIALARALFGLHDPEEARRRRNRKVSSWR